MKKDSDISTSNKILNDVVYTSDGDRESVCKTFIRHTLPRRNANIEAQIDS